MRHAMPLLAVLSLAFAPAPFPRHEPRRQDDLTRLQGEWSVLSKTIDGRKFPPNGERVTVAARTLTHLTGGRATRWEVVLDPTKEPKRLDYRGGRGEEVLVIYRLEGDVLTLCWRNDDNANGRPVDFEGGIGLGVSVLKRTKR